MSVQRRFLPVLPGFLVFMLGLSTAPIVHAKAFISSSKATNIIELYTSEGCSSCPPADRWLSTLKEKDNVFSHFIPMAFHVDYWNYLGWKDRFSDEAFSQRQRRHTKAGNTRQVYTPQFVVNSKDWRGWFLGLRSWEQRDQRPVGILKAELKPEQAHLLVSFDAASPQILKEETLLNVAVLGMGLETAVKSGENSNRLLKHDFVVLNHTRNTIKPTDSQWRLKAPVIPQAGQKQTVLVVWLSDYPNQHIIQAVAGYL